MQNSIPVGPTDRVGVVCHDAGATNLLVEWVRDCLDRVSVCMQGPAEKIWRTEFPDMALQSMEEVIDEADVVISGTGIRSDLEYDARRISAEKGVKSVAVIDHWLNYRERFIRNGELQLADEIWLSDTYAEKLAQEFFPGTSIILLPNRYLDRQVQEIEFYDPGPARNPPGKILFLQEDIGVDWVDGPYDDAQEYQTLRYFLDNLENIGVDTGMVQIRLRPHPSETTGKYADWPKKYPNVKLEIKADGPLSEQIAWADWVVGCETFGLVVALHAGRKCISALPPWAHECRLPHNELIHIRDLIYGG